MNIEKLLGKLLQEAMGSGGGQFKAPQQGYQKSGHADRHAASSGSLLGSLTSQLTSGKGLMTAIGLGVGAYEVFRTSGQRQEQPAPPPPPPSAARPASAAAPSADGDQELARRLIRVMIAAAHADGALDADEERAILDRLRGAELSQEEKMFLLEELHHPRSVAELTEGISSLRLAQAMYAVALSAIEVDTESERRWLDELGTALGLSAEIRRFIEETR